jgi:hypothetical protein
MSESEIVKGYKATSTGMICRGYQYILGEWHNHDGSISMCNSGFHFCENPLDVLDYYDLCDSEFYQVEAEKKDCKKEDKKTVTGKIKISAKIGIPGLISASVEYIKNLCGNSETNASGYSSQLAASGYSSQLAASGNYSQLAASGDYSQLAASGDYSQLAASGYYSSLAP